VQKFPPNFWDRTPLYIFLRPPKNFCDVTVLKDGHFGGNAMPYKRKRSSSRPVRRKQLGGHRRKLPRRRLTRSKRGSSLSMHRYSRYGLASTITLTNTEDSTAYSFAFNDIINSSEFAALYDRYRLDKVIVKLQLINNPNGITPLNTSISGTTWANSLNWYPKVWSVVDHDDSSAETIAQLKERSGVKCRILQPNKTLTYAIRPAISAMMYKTATSTGYGPKWGQWIDMQDIGVPQYGLKLAFDMQGNDPISTDGFKVVVEKKFYFTCKDVR